MCSQIPEEKKKGKEGIVNVQQENGNQKSGET